MQWVLGNVFHTPVNSLSLAELQPLFSSMSLEDQTLLESIATCSDAIPDHPSFLLIDRVSIAVFIALDILGGECAGVLRSDSVGQEFMAVHMRAVAEVLAFSNICSFCLVFFLIVSFAACSDVRRLDLPSVQVHESSGVSGSD